MLSTCSIRLVWTSSSCQCSSLRNFVDFLLDSFLRGSGGGVTFFCSNPSWGVATQAVRWCLWARVAVSSSKAADLLCFWDFLLSLFIYTCAQRFAEGRTSTCDPTPGPYPYPLSALLEHFGSCSEALPTWGSRWWPCLAQLCWSAASGMQPTWTGNLCDQIHATQFVFVCATTTLCDTYVTVVSQLCCSRVAFLFDFVVIQVVQD